MQALVLGLPAWLASTPAVAAAGAPGPSLVQRIRGLEADGRAHPAAASEALRALLPMTAEGSAERLELLVVDGLVLSVASMEDAAHRDLDQLVAWGHAPARPLAAGARAAALLIRASILSHSGDLEQARTLLVSATRQLPADVPAVARYRFVTADSFIATEAGRLGDAVRLGHEAVALAERTEAPWRQSEARIALAFGYYNAQQYERAARIVQEAVTLSTKALDWVSLGRARNIEGIVANGLGDLPGERRAFEAAIECARRAGSKIDEVRYLANLADFFLQTADYPTALHYAELALPLARELNDRNSVNVALTNVGLAQISMHRRDAGMRNVLAAIAMEEARGSVIGAAESWRNIGVYLERAGDVAAAVDAYHRHRRLLGEVLQGNQQKAVLALQEQYDADDRARALTLLERDSAIKAEQLHRRDLRLWVGGLLAVASLLSLATVASFYGRVRANNRRLARSNEALRVQGAHDPLTGLANRRHFDAVIGAASPDGWFRGSAFLIDIDHFKAINDRIGHPAGDAVLVEVARRLRSTLRDDDLLVRWGGEEFLIVAQGLGATQVTALVQRLLNVLEDLPVHTDTGSIGVTASIGFATFPLGPAALRVSCEQAVGLADAAMYLAKADGRNRACGVLEVAGAPADGAWPEEVLADLDAAVRQGRVLLSTVRGRRRAAPPQEHHACDARDATVPVA